MNRPKLSLVIGHCDLFKDTACPYHDQFIYLFNLLDPLPFRENEEIHDRNSALSRNGVKIDLARSISAEDLPLLTMGAGGELSTLKSWNSTTDRTW